MPASHPGGGGLRVQSRVGRQQSLFPAALPRARTDTITNLLSFGLPSRAYEDLCESDPVDTEPTAAVSRTREDLSERVLALPRCVTICRGWDRLRNKIIPLTLQSSPLLWLNAER